MKIDRIFRGLVSLGMVAALAGPVVLARSQDPAMSPEQGKGMRGGLQAALESMKLTDDQKAKVRDIFTDAKSKRDVVTTDASLSDDQKKARMKDLHESTLAKVNGLLTPDQQTELRNKLDAAKAKAPTPQ